jgi:hypothetical protein
MAEQEKESLLGTGAWDAIIAGGVLSLVAAPVVAAYQGLIWLKKGEAPHLDLHSVFGTFSTETSWVGITKILTWVCNVPLAALLAVIGAGVILLGGEGWKNARQRERERPARSE